MTCSSCANRIERKLNKLEGVEASVNFATERAAVDYDPARVDADELVGLVEAAGYGASLPERADKQETEDAERDDELASLRLRLIVAAALSVPIFAMAMVPALQFDYWQWVSLQLATPVVLWGGWPFHRVAWRNLKHAAANMDTLISLGTLAAFGWSLYALYFGDAGDPSMRHGFSIRPERGMGS